MTAEFIILRLVHILGGIFWLGSGLFTTLFLVPALGRLGPAGAGPVMGALQQRRLFTVLPLVAVVTILSGARLLHIASSGFASVYFTTATGRTLLWSGVAAVTGFLLSLVVARPAMVRAGQLGASMATLAEAERGARAAEIERLRRRGANASALAILLLLVAGAGMAVARYLH
jgi:uncharacterized membrane protein